LIGIAGAAFGQLRATSLAWDLAGDFAGGRRHFLGGRSHGLHIRRRHIGDARDLIGAMALSAAV
jgi:hypothetical protein